MEVAVRRAWKGWVAAAVVGASPAALAATVVEPRLKLSLEERYDDDFRLNLGGTGGQLMTKMSPKLGLDVKDPTLTLDSFYAADFLMRHGSGNLSLDHRGGLTVKKFLTRRLRVEVSGNIYRVTDPTSLPRESVARAASPVLYGTSRLYVSEKLSRRVDVGAGYSFEGVKLLELGPTQPGFVHTPFAEAWLRTTRRLSLGLEYRYQAFLYGENLDQAHTLSAALRYRLTRHTTFTARGGPVSYLGGDGTRGLLPRVKLELAHEAGRFDLGLVAGHDLVGASGFTTALWADYAGMVFNHHFTPGFSLYGTASFFRNGHAPGEGAFQWQKDPTVSQGYAVGAGVEFKVNRYMSVQGAVDRIAQVGVAEAAAAVGLTRNVAAVRLHMTAW